MGNTKAQDGKSTLLHFLANVTETKYPDIINFHEDLVHLDKAARGRTEMRDGWWRCTMLLDEDLSVLIT